MQVHVVTVFVGPDGGGGNLLGVVLEGAPPPEERQRVAAELGFSETVFVADLDTAALHIHTPATELPLAGHPLVGTSWLLASLGRPVDVLRPPAGEVPTWVEAGLTWIRARPEWAPEFDTRRLSTPADVDAVDGVTGGEDLHVWAWEDEAAGRVRARVFPMGMGIAEDEATGSAALRLGALLGRPLTIRQGRGSQLLVRPGPAGTYEVGGTVRPVEVRTL